MNKLYYFIVETNKYAGGFERELCAHMTGCIGECGVGKEFVDETIKKIFDDKIYWKPDDYGCARPVEIYPGKDQKYNSLSIFFNEKPTKKEIELLKERAKTFKFEKGIKILGFKLLEVKQVEKEIKI